MALGANGGLHMTQDDLLRLVHILALTQGVKLSTVSVWATNGSNPMLFDRLAAGRGCSTLTLETAATWFRLNWPRDLEWPSGIPR